MDDCGEIWMIKLIELQSNSRQRVSTAVFSNWFVVLCSVLHPEHHTRDFALILVLSVVWGDQSTVAHSPGNTLYHPLLKKMIFKTFFKDLF